MGILGCELRRYREGDLLVLEQGELARRAYFQRRAAELYEGRTCALSRTVSDGIAIRLIEIARDLQSSPVAELTYWETEQ